MNDLFELQVTNTYKKGFDQLTHNNKRLKKRIGVALEKLAIDPTHPSLKSHRVSTKNYGIRWSSRVTGNLRIIWDYDQKKRLIILLLAIDSHTGTHKVYK